MNRWLFHPWLEVRVPFVLGLLFITAAIPKIVGPYQFANAVRLYQLVPAWSIIPFATVVAGLELLCGLALCLGLKLRLAARVATGLILLFVVALAINLARGLPVDCGCFTASRIPGNPMEALKAMRLAIFRDLALLLLALQVLLRPQPAKPPE
jgi:uncharacterized membrane protein YphA (DoxX/SURF4 family)